MLLNLRTTDEWIRDIILTLNLISMLALLGSFDPQPPRLLSNLWGPKWAPQDIRW